MSYSQDKSGDIQIFFFLLSTNLSKKDQKEQLIVLTSIVGVSKVPK